MMFVYYKGKTVTDAVVEKAISLNNHHYTNNVKIRHCTIKERQV